MIDLTLSFRILVRRDKRSTGVSPAFGMVSLSGPWPEAKPTSRIMRLLRQSFTGVKMRQSWIQRSEQSLKIS